MRSASPHSEAGQSLQGSAANLAGLVLTDSVVGRTAEGRAAATNMARHCAQEGELVSGRAEVLWAK